MNRSQQQNLFQKSILKLLPRAKIQSVLDVLVNIIRRYAHLLTRNVSFVKTRDILQKSAERKLNQIYQLNNFQMSFRKQLMRANLMKIFLTIYQLDHKKFTLPTVITISIENQNIPVEIDTGASISLINWETFKKINCNSNIILLPTSCKLKTYSGEIVNPKGQCEIEFYYKNRKLKILFLITDKKSPNLLGRDILGKLKLNWESIFNSYVVTEKCNSNNESLNKIISEYESVFSDELGTLKDVEIEMPIQPNVNLM